MAATNFFCAGMQTKQLWRRWIPAFNFTKLRAYVSDKKLLRPLFLFFLTFSTYKVVPTHSGLAISLKTTVITEISVRNLVSYTSYFWLKEHNLGHNDKFLCFSSSARIDFEGPGERKKKHFCPFRFCQYWVHEGWFPEFPPLDQFFTSTWGGCEQKNSLSSSSSLFKPFPKMSRFPIHRSR